MSEIWQIVKLILKIFNIWFDKQADGFRLVSLMVFGALSLLLINSDSILLSLSGFGSLIFGTVQRWMYIEGKL